MILKEVLIYSLSVTIFFLISCKEKYAPSVITQNLNYLVVDGSIINGPDSTIIRLSRTGYLDENPKNGGEHGAQMTIEDTAGNTIYNFIEINDKGMYALPSMNLDINKKYRLRINTGNGGHYVSDDLVVKDSPPIDSISWRRTPDGVTIYTNTHDPQNNSVYYRWEYIETFYYHAFYYSLIKFVQGTTLDLDSIFPYRNPDEFVYYCWKTVKSDRLLLANSTKLSSDVISMSPIRFIPVSSIELSMEYSILVKQYVVSKEAFEYLENLKKISEQTGSIFDAQPSELTGNIHSVDRPDEPVIGFISASSVPQKRIFITNEQVDPWNYLQECPELKMISTQPMSQIILDTLNFSFGNGTALLIPVEKVRDFRSNRIIYVTGGTPLCVDCRAQGGVTVKPDFWP